MVTFFSVTNLGVLWTCRGENHPVGSFWKLTCFFNKTTGLKHIFPTNSYMFNYLHTLSYIHVYIYIIYTYISYIYDLYIYDIYIYISYHIYIYINIIYIYIYIYIIYTYISYIYVCVLCICHVMLYVPHFLIKCGRNLVTWSPFILPWWSSRWTRRRRRINRSVPQGLQLPVEKKHFFKGIFMGL